MDEAILIDEKYSNNWKLIFYTSLFLAAVTFLIHLNLNDVVWSGILRLVAFISFSLSIFCILKLFEGQKKFRVAVDGKSVHIAYLKKDKIVREEVLDLNDITGIYRTPSVYRVPVIGIQIQLSNTWLFKVSIADTEQDSSLFTFGGRALPVDQKSSLKLEQFLQTHNLHSNS